MKTDCFLKPAGKGAPVMLLGMICVLVAGAISGCSSVPKSALKSVQDNRLSAIPAGREKMTAGSDSLPPILHSSEYSSPEPLGPSVNTPGGEDSAFILPDGKTLYFFFTPDVSVPAEKQLLDGVTGIWRSGKDGNTWSEAERVVLEGKNELALDGAAFVGGDEMWFASARKGNYRGVDIWRAVLKGGHWTDWRNAGRQLNVDYEAGEFHFSPDGGQMYFHSARTGGKGGLDIWVTRRSGTEWTVSENISAVNTEGDEGWPFLTEDGRELWFTRTYMGSPAIFRSTKTEEGWSEPELIISQFAGEPSLDSEGNIYFTHHYFRDGKMIEADIYVACRRG